MKKIFFIITVVVLLLGVKVSAEELCGTAKLFEYPEIEKETDDAVLFELNTSEKNARDELARGMRSMQSQVNIAFARVSVDRIFAVVNAAYLENPELYYVHDEYYYWYTGTVESGYVTRIDFTYLYSKSQIEVYDTVIEKEKEYVLSLMDDSMTELEKVMLVHNYITTNHTYDYSYTIYNIYDFFTKRTGVCQAYALAMTYFLRAAGVECVHAYSYEMNHDWNLVKVDGMWYHVDATWDDTWSNSENVCSYRYFMKSDYAFFNSLEHYGWDSEHEATSAWYDDYYFTDYRAPFLYQDGEWYMLREGNLYRINNLKYGGEELVFESGATYKNGWHPDYDMSFAVYENSFIYNVYDEIYVVNLNDYAKPRKIADAEADDYKVYFLKVNGGTLYYKTGRTGADYSHTLDLSKVVSLVHFEIMDVSATEGYVYLRYNCDNLYDRDWCIYVASYDEDNIMIDIQAVEPGKSAIEVPGAARYEAFIWEGCMPLCDSVSVE